MEENVPEIDVADNDHDSVTVALEGIIDGWHLKCSTNCNSAIRPQSDRIQYLGIVPSTSTSSVLDAVKV
jgi:hypothetical protein